MRGFPVLLRVGYSVVCAAGWCGKLSCAGAVHMVVRGWGVVGGCVHSVLGMVRGSGLAQRSNYVVFQCECMHATQWCARWDGAVSGAAWRPRIQS
jgi:hypothetical protein